LPYIPLYPYRLEAVWLTVTETTKGWEEADRPGVDLVREARIIGGVLLTVLLGGKDQQAGVAHAGEERGEGQGYSDEVAPL